MGRFLGNVASINTEAGPVTLKCIRMLEAKTEALESATAQIVRNGQAVSVTGIQGVSGGGKLTVDQTLYLDQSFSPTWTGHHAFEPAANIVPVRISRTSDLTSGNLLSILDEVANPFVVVNNSGLLGINTTPDAMVAIRSNSGAYATYADSTLSVDISGLDFWYAADSGVTSGGVGTDVTQWVSKAGSAGLTLGGVRYPDVLHYVDGSGYTGVRIKDHTGPDSSGMIGNSSVGGMTQSGSGGEFTLVVVSAPTSATTTMNVIKNSNLASGNYVTGGITMNTFAAPYPKFQYSTNSASPPSWNAGGVTAGISGAAADWVSIKSLTFTGRYTSSGQVNGTATLKVGNGTYSYDDSYAFDPVQLASGGDDGSQASGIVGNAFGNGSPTATQNQDYVLYEVLWYRRRLTDVEMEAVADYMRGKYQNGFGDPAVTYDMARFENRATTVLSKIDENGRFGFGVTDPLYPLDILTTAGTQQRLGYSATQYYTTAVDLAGRVTFDAVGTTHDFTFADAVNFSVAPVFPASSYATPPANSVNVSAPTSGSLLTFARSDATYQINQAIVPTWTAVHTYSAQDVHNAGLSLGSVGTMTSAVTDATAASAYTFTAPAMTSGADRYLYNIKDSAGNARFTIDSAGRAYIYGGPDLTGNGLLTITGLNTVASAGFFFAPIFSGLSGISFAGVSTALCGGYFGPLDSSANTATSIIAGCFVNESVGTHAHTGQVTGGIFKPVNSWSSNGTNTHAVARGIAVLRMATGPLNQTVTTAIGLEIEAMTRTALGTTDTYGIFLAEQLQATNKYGLWLANATAAYKAIAIRDKNAWIGSSAEARIDIGATEFLIQSSKIGFFNTAPVVKSSAYTPTNVTTDRSYDANATTIDEVADVLGTLIADLQAYGLIA